MRKKGLVRIAALLLICCVLYGCGKGKGSIYGIVIDLGTDEPVANAMVYLQPCSSSLNVDNRLTGHDGMFEFIDIKDGDYILKVSKNEYGEFEDDNVIMVRNGERIKRDFLIEKLPVVFTNEITEIMSLGNLGWNVTLNGCVASTGFPEYVERGFHFGSYENYYLYGTYATLVVPGNGTGNYSTTLRRLSEGELYWVRAYVKTLSNRLVVGEEILIYISTSDLK